MKTYRLEVDVLNGWQVRRLKRLRSLAGDRQVVVLTDNDERLLNKLIKGVRRGEEDAYNRPAREIQAPAPRRG